MTEPKSKQNIDSILARLKNHAKESGENLTFVLARFGAERLLYRLGESSYKQRFILKGGTLLLVWLGKSYRVTRDVDFLGFGASDVEEIEAVFREICQLNVDYDGLSFSPDKIKAAVIRDDANYAGVRIKIVAMLGKTRIPLQVDIGFGDVVTPEIDTVDFPTLLEMPQPTLHAYTKYTVIAEKFEVMVELGIRNSRMKDFYDIWIISRLFTFEGETLQKAILATFERRKSRYPTQIPFVFTPEYYADSGKQDQWKAFVNKSNLNTLSEEISLESIIKELEYFLMPIINAETNKQLFSQAWSSITQEWI